MMKPYLCFSCSHTPGVDRFLKTLKSSGVMDQVNPILFAWEPYPKVPVGITVYKQNSPYKGNKAARFPLIAKIPELGLDSWYVWLDTQDIIFQTKLPSHFCDMPDTGVFDTYVCPENVLHSESDFWSPICQNIDEWKPLLHQPVYNSGIFAMKGAAILSYFGELAVPSQPGRYGPTNRYDGDQLIFNKWLHQRRGKFGIIENMFLSLYASYTGPQWTGQNQEAVKTAYSIYDNGFKNPDNSELYSVVHAPGSTKVILDKLIPNEDNKNTSEYGSVLKQKESEPVTTEEDVKFAAICAVYNEEATIAYCLKSIYNHVSKIVITTSEFTWSGEKQPLDQTVNIIKSFPDPDKKIHLIQGKWPRDDYARNDALDYLEKEGYDYAAIVDGDELWDWQPLLKLKMMMATDPSRIAARCSWHTYWKDVYHRIDPPEDFYPIVMVKVNAVRFAWIREVVQASDISTCPRDISIIHRPARIGYSQDPRCLVIKDKNVMLHHLSWSRPDQLVKDKIQKSPHRQEFVKGWFENVWQKWDEDNGLENLHPTNPQQFKKAIKVPEGEGPSVISRYEIVLDVNDKNDITKVDFKEREPEPKDIKSITLADVKKHGKVLRENVINYFTAKFERCRYLEIGSQARDCFGKIKAAIKHDCEPNPPGRITPHFKGTSDEFFATLAECGLDSEYDVIFVDGLHKCEQVLKDVKNASKHLSKDGWILCHDNLPKEYVDQLREMTEENKKRWLGDCYKASAFLVKNFENVWVASGTDQGFCIIKNTVNIETIPPKEDLCDNLTWRQYVEEKETLLRCTPWEKLIEDGII